MFSTAFHLSSVMFSRFAFNFSTRILQIDLAIGEMIFFRLNLCATQAPTARSTEHNAPLKVARIGNQ